MQWPAGTHGSALAVQRVRDGERVWVALDDGAQPRPARIQRLDAFEVHLGEAPRREPALTHRRAEAGDASLLYLGVRCRMLAHRASSFSLRWFGWLPRMERLAPATSPAQPAASKTTMPRPGASPCSAANASLTWSSV